MEAIRKEVVRTEEVGYKFSVKLSDGYEYKIEVDNDGNVILADYGSMHGWCTAHPGESDFKEAMCMVMNGILEHNINEFKKMREHLNEKYRSIAESVRREKASKWDF